MMTTSGTTVSTLCIIINNHHNLISITIVPVCHILEIIVRLHSCSKSDFRCQRKNMDPINFSVFCVQINFLQTLAPPSNKLALPSSFLFQLMSSTHKKWLPCPKTVISLKWENIALNLNLVNSFSWQLASLLLHLLLTNTLTLGIWLPLSEPDF